MIITMRSPITGMINAMDVDVTEVQIMQWQNGMLIQDAMPDLSVDEREFIMTGTTPADWEKMYEL